MSSDAAERSVVESPEKPLYRVAILGGGSFGTALANLVADNGHQACLWARDPAKAQTIDEKHENPFYLPGIPLNPNITVTHELPTALASADVVFFAIPSQSFRTVAEESVALLDDEAILVSATKGIRQDGEQATFRLMSTILEDVTQSRYIGVLSGPNIAKEIAERSPTGSVIASSSERVQRVVHEVLSGDYFRAYCNADRFGVELAGALKNIYAIASGMAVALGMGENTKSMLITRSLAEMSRLAVHMGANPLTFLGLAGVGDLIVTCASQHSRNFQVGYALGEGLTLDEAVQRLGQVAEGVNTIRLVCAHAERSGVRMPIAQGLNRIIFHHEPLSAVAGELMHGENTQDVDTAWKPSEG